MFLGLFNAIRTLTVDDKILVIQSPPWIGWACIVAGIVIMLGAFVRTFPRPVRLGALLGTLLLIYGGWHLLRNAITFESRGFYVESPLGEDMRIGWSRVAAIDAGGLKGAKNSEPDHVVFQLRGGGEADVDLAGLSPDEQGRVVAFVQKRLKP